MKRVGLIGLCISIWICPLLAQTIVKKEKQMTPLSLGSNDQTRGMFSSKTPEPPDKYTVQYINVSPGPNGEIKGLSQDSMLNKNLSQEFNFPSLFITISNASRILIDEIEPSGRIGSSMKAATALKQLSMNIKLTPLDGNQQPMVKIKKFMVAEIGNSIRYIQEFGKEPLLILGIEPSESLFANQQSLSSKVSDSIYGAVDASRNLSEGGTFASVLNPIGTLATGISTIFRIFCPTQNLPNQISYISSPQEFGWIWREHENYGVEGIHLSAALLRVHKSVKYILVQVELMADWKRFGAWLTPTDFIIPINSGEK